MKKLSLVLAVLILANCLACPALAADLAKSVVLVVSLDEKGQPLSQGQGVILTNGLVLTDAALLLQSRPVIIKTANGAFHVADEAVWQDALQGLALVNSRTLDLKSAVALSAESLTVPASVRVGVSTGKGTALHEARVIGSHPFSPRLTLLKIEPADLKTPPGAPVFNEQGQLIGMFHGFYGVRLCLAHHGKALPEKLREAQPEGLAAPLQNHAADSSAVFWEGVEASLRQKWQQAEEKFSLALQTGESLPEASFGRGVARYHLGRHEEAARDLYQSTRRLPGYALAFLWLGRNWEALGQRQDAENAYRQATSLAPELSDAWFHLGLLACQEGKLAQAREYFGKAKDDFPQAAEKWWHLGQIAQSEGRLDQAEEAFDRAIGLNPNFLAAYLERGKVLLNLGQPQEAARLLQQVADRHPQRASVRYHLALAHLLSWNRAAAWEQYFALQKLKPELAVRLAPVMEKNY